jgi:hypothetical protein
MEDFMWTKEKLPKKKRSSADASVLEWNERLLHIDIARGGILSG